MGWTQGALGGGWQGAGPARAFQHAAWLATALLALAPLAVAYEVGDTFAPLYTGWGRLAWLPKIGAGFNFACGFEDSRGPSTTCYWRVPGYVKLYVWKTRVEPHRGTDWVDPGLVGATRLEEKTLYPGLVFDLPAPLERYQVEVVEIRNGFSVYFDPVRIRVTEQPAAPPPSCNGNGVCEEGEDAASCPGDCRQPPPACRQDTDCGEGAACLDGACVSVPSPPLPRSRLDCSQEELENGAVALEDCACVSPPEKNALAAVVKAGGVLDDNAVLQALERYLEAASRHRGVPNAGVKKFSGDTPEQLDAFLEALYARDQAGYVLLVGTDLAFGRRVNPFTRTAWLEALANIEGNAASPPRPLPACDGDGVCEPAGGETPQACPSDCAAPQPPGEACDGDGVCEALQGESRASCPSDCEAPPVQGPACDGDGVCEPAGGETPEACPSDCRQEPVSYPCLDSDNGKDFYAFGAADGIFDESPSLALVVGADDADHATPPVPDPAIQPPATVFIDHCEDADASNILNEAYCGSDGLLHRERYPCPHGCRDGVCLNAPSSVSACDNDGVCTAPETPETCPADCQAPPEPTDYRQAIPAEYLACSTDRDCVLAPGDLCSCPFTYMVAVNRASYRSYTAFRNAFFNLPGFWRELASSQRKGRQQYCLEQVGAWPPQGFTPSPACRPLPRAQCVNQQCVAKPRATGTLTPSPPRAPLSAGVERAYLQAAPATGPVYELADVVRNYDALLGATVQVRARYTLPLEGYPELAPLGGGGVIEDRRLLELEQDPSLEARFQREIDDGTLEALVWATGVDTVQPPLEMGKVYLFTGSLGWFPWDRLGETQPASLSNFTDLALALESAQPETALPQDLSCNNDGACTPPENAATCPQDCGATPPPPPTAFDARCRELAVAWLPEPAAGAAEEKRRAVAAVLERFAALHEAGEDAFEGFYPGVLRLQEGGARAPLAYGVPERAASLSEREALARLLSRGHLWGYLDASAQALERGLNGPEGLRSLAGAARPPFLLVDLGAWDAGKTAFPGRQTPVSWPAAFLQAGAWAYYGALGLPEEVKGFQKQAAHATVGEAARASFAATVLVFGDPLAGPPASLQPPPEPQRCLEARDCFEGDACVEGACARARLVGFYPEEKALVGRRVQEGVVAWTLFNTGNRPAVLTRALLKGCNGAAACSLESVQALHGPLRRVPSEVVAALAPFPAQAQGTALEDLAGVVVPPFQAVRVRVRVRVEDDLPQTLALSLATDYAAEDGSTQGAWTGTVQVKAFPLETGAFQVLLKAREPGACLGPNGRVGRTGPAAVPRVRLAWDWDSFPYNACEAGAPDGVFCDATQFTIALVQRLHRVELLQRAGQPGAEAEAAKLLSFRALLVRDRFSEDFQRDFAYHYSAGFFEAPSFFTDPLTPWHRLVGDPDRLRFSPQEVREPGVYRVEVSIDGDALFEQGAPAARVTVSLALEQAAEEVAPASVFYRIPFDGGVGSTRLDKDGARARRFYGTGFVNASGAPLPLALRGGEVVAASALDALDRFIARVESDWKTLNHARRGVLASFSLPEKSAWFAPAAAVPVAAAVEGRDRVAEAFYRPVRADGARLEDASFAARWTGIGASPDLFVFEDGKVVCRDFAGNPLLLDKPDTPAQAMAFSCVADEDKPGAYGVRWEPVQDGQRVFLAATFFVPEGEAWALELLCGKALLAAPEGLSSGPTDPVSLGQGARVRTLEDLFAAVADGKACVDDDGRQAVFFWNRDYLAGEGRRVAGRLAEAWGFNWQEAACPLPVGAGGENP